MKPIQRLLASLVCTLVAFAGCAGPGPRLLPPVPARVDVQPDHGTLQWYDTDANGKTDYCERLNADGRLDAIGYDGNGDGQPDETIVLADIPPGQRRDLLMILDSVPYGMVQEAWQHGLLRMFPAPTRTIATFPVMTDPCLVDFFQMAPGIAIESDYCDGRRETDAYGIYLRGGVALWHAHTDYYLRHNMHAWAYLDPLPWFDHELRRIQDRSLTSRKPSFVGYCVGTSALGAVQGRDGHAAGLNRVDRFCRDMLRQSRGTIRITLMSDHGHNLVNSHRIPLSELLGTMGYRVTSRLEKPGDVILPEFAMATCSAMYTRDGARIARDVLSIDGIELAAYREADDTVTVLSRGGCAHLRRQADGYAYEPAFGDPLQLVPILESLRKESKLDHSGFISDQLLCQATQNHVYVDPVDRLWRAFHDDYQYKPDVLISVLDGYHTGSPFQSRVIDLAAAHGNLRMLSSSGFAATMAGPLPPVLRMRELMPALEKAGVTLKH